MYPLFLDLTDRLCVVVGGGPVGLRKTTGLLDGGARVRLVCREPQPASLRHGRLDWRHEEYRAEHLAGACLAFAAATPEVNRRVVADAKERGTWVTCADEPASGDFVVPAVVRRGDLVIAVGTGGAAPALARRVRAKLAEQFDDAFGRWVGLLAGIRPTIRQRIADPQQRKLLFEELTDWSWLERLRNEPAELVRNAMAARVDELAKGSGDAL